jgi:hypothetical protein
MSAKSAPPLIAAVHQRSSLTNPTTSIPIKLNRLGLIKFTRLVMHRSIYLALYYILAIRLPSTSMPGGYYGNLFRNWLASKLFKSCGNNVNIK